MTAPLDTGAGEGTPEIQPWRELRARKPAIPYLLYYPAIREAARSCGYALAIHGSLARDFDLIAVAWTPEATDADTLVHAICDATEWMVTVPPKPGEKPHGRLGYTLMATGTETLRGAWVDLSVIPPTLLKNLNAADKACKCGHDAGSHDRTTGYCRAQKSRRNPCGCRAFRSPSTTDSSGAA